MERFTTRLPEPPVAELAPRLEPSAAPLAPGTTDERLIELWLQGRPPTTRRAYADDLARFRAFVRKPLRAVLLEDLERYARSLPGAEHDDRPDVDDRLRHLATRNRRLMAVKSLFGYAARVGYVAFDLGAVIRPPKVPSRLAERILEEQAVLAMLRAVEGHRRDHALIRALYNGGFRVSELVALRWRNLVDGVANVAGKGGRNRVVRLSRGTWHELLALRPPGAGPDGRVFPITAWNAWDRVRRAARAAGLKGTPVSPHWLRHAHGTHALQKGADVATVRDTLGHASIATTSRYLHARPGTSSGDYLAV